jgi:pimeloyl-ACP methyl ester carboxylesterase
MLALGEGRGFRVYALDFWGFGDSAKGGLDGNNPSFRIDSYVAMVRQFMDTLGVLGAPVVGHSMGGTVALKFALENPGRVRKVAAVGAPIVGTTLNPFLKLAGYDLIADLVWRFPGLLKLVMYSILARDSKQVREMIFHDVQRTTLESFFRSIGDLRDTDLRPRLPELNTPILGVFGSNDNIVSPRNATILKTDVPHAQTVMMTSSRHFPMSDEPDKFLRALISFLGNNDS